jgi:hypothetical protein
MRMEFTPRHFLHLVSLPLLRTYFEQRRLLLNFDWDGLGESVEPLYSACKALPSQERQVAWVDFETVYGLCSRRGLQTLLDASGRSREDVAASMGKGSIADKVFRVLLAHPDVFVVASHFAWADGLKRYWQPRQDVPAAEPAVDPESLVTLKNAVVARYQELDDRGEYSEVEAHWRGDVLYIMIYISDHPESVVHFEGSNQLKRTTQQRAFDVVYRYEPASGAFEMYAEGARELRRSLAQEFVTTILRQNVTLPLEEQLVFDLDKLKDPSFQFKIDRENGVKSMELLSMRLAAPGTDGGRITFGTLPREKKPQLHSFIRRGLNESELPLGNLAVEHVTIRARVANGTQRASTVTFQISSANTCNLKDTLAHNKIRTCLKRSGVVRGQAAGAAPQTN